MTYLFYFGHPAQYLFLRETMRRLKAKGYKVIILIKTKDVLESIVKSDGFSFHNILPKARGNSKISIVFSLLKRNLKIVPFIIKYKPKLLISTDASVAQLGRLFNIDSICTTEDDYEVIKNLADVAYPLANHILCPNVCNVGKWDHKKIGYEGYMKLGYLHPNVFTPSNTVLNKYSITSPYVLIRLAKLVAYHDVNAKAKGLTGDVVKRLINLFETKGYNVFISSESVLTDDLKHYELSINPIDMHHILSFSSVLVCDSQSMAVEASMLGVASIRYSSFSGKISVLEELEHNYKLTKAVSIGEEDKLYETVREVIKVEGFEELFKKRQVKMLNDKIDVTEFLVNLFENYPESLKSYK